MIVRANGCNCNSLLVAVLLEIGLGWEAVVTDLLVVVEFATWWISLMPIVEILQAVEFYL